MWATSGSRHPAAAPSVRSPEGACDLRAPHVCLHAQRHHGQPVQRGRQTGCHRSSAGQLAETFITCIFASAFKQSKSTITNRKVFTFCGSGVFISSVKINTGCPMSCPTMTTRPLRSSSSSATRARASWCTGWTAEGVGKMVQGAHDLIRGTQAIPATYLQDVEGISTHSPDGTPPFYLLSEHVREGRPRRQSGGDRIRCGWAGLVLTRTITPISSRISSGLSKFHNIQF